jgi:uncharacterized protein (DUF1778 family)
LNQTWIQVAAELLCLAASCQRFRWRTTHCQLRCRSAWRYFLTKASGSITAAQPDPALKDDTTFLDLFPALLRLSRQGVRLGRNHIAAAAVTSSPLRSKELDLRLTPEAKQTLQRAAAVAKRSVTDFVLESALASAAETLADRQSFQLEQEQWQSFVAAIDAPPKLHPRLARLLQQPSVLEQAQAVDAG